MSGQVFCSLAEASTVSSGSGRAAETSSDSGGLRRLALPPHLPSWEVATPSLE